jgi:hypothetical protein
VKGKEKGMGMGNGNGKGQDEGKGKEKGTDERGGEWLWRGRRRSKLGESLGLGSRVWVK